MFKTLTRLLFGGEEETPAEVTSADVLEEGWLVVNHHDTSCAESQDAEVKDGQQLDSAPHGDTNMDGGTSLSIAEPIVPSSSSSSSSSSGVVFPGSYFPPKALTEVSQLTFIQRADAWAQRHHTSRNAIQRHNRLRQGVQHHSFHLQQPGHRNLSH